MKAIKWKVLILTCIVALSPMLLGIALWGELPDSVAIHFNIYNVPDNFTSKGFAVFGLPALMALLQIVCCITSDINARKHGEGKKFERVAKWIIPVMSIVLYVATLGFALGHDVDIRRVAMLIAGIVLVVTGNYLPKLDYVKNYKVDTDKARRINRFIGYETVIMGALMLISIFLPPIASVISVALLIPYTVVAAIYGIKVGKNDGKASE